MGIYTLPYKIKNAKQLPSYSALTFPKLYNAQYVNTIPAKSVDLDWKNVAKNITPKANRGSGLAKFFSKFGPGKALFGKGDGGATWDSIKQLPSNVRATSLFEGGPTLGKLASGAMAGYQGIDAVRNISDLSSADTNLSDQMNDIKAMAYANPMIGTYLDPAQQKLLRQVRSGTVANGTAGEAMGNVIKNLPKALLMTAIGGVTGGGLGAVSGGLGTLVNSGIEGASTSKNNTASKLEGLYSALSQANQDYRDNTNEHLRNRHFNMYY